MVRRHRRSRCWLVAFSGSLACWVASAADPLPQQVEHPFRNLAAWLREASPDMRSADPKVISRGITVLSNSQSYVKSFDGMAYELKGKIKEGGSTADIDKLLEQAELYESRSSAKKARKLVKLLIQVERSLNSAEAAEIAAQSDPARAAQYMKDAGLRFLPEPPPPPPPPPPMTPEEKNGTTAASATSAEGVVEGAKSTEMASKVPARSRDGSSSRSTGGKTAAKRAAARTTADIRRAPSPSSSVAASAAAERGGTGGGNIGRKEKKKGKKSNKESGKPGRGVAAARPEGSGEPLETFVVTVAGCEVRCLLMLEEPEGGGDREGEGEGEGGRLLVAVGDSLTGAALLQSLFEEPAVVQLASHGLMRETAYVNRAAFQAACDILEWAGPLIKASVEPGGPFAGYRVHCAGHSFGGAVAACLAGLLDGAIDLEAPPAGDHSSVVGGRGESESGRSGGGGGGGAAGAASAAAMSRRQRERKEKAALPGGRREVFRDRRAGNKGSGSRGGVTGRLSDPSSSEGSEESGEDGGGVGGGDGGAVRVRGGAPWVAACRDTVTCVTLGCPPCLSQNLRLPFVTSFVLGDDMVPRTSHESLRRLKRRLLQVMPKRKGLLSQGVAFSTSLFTDVAGVALQGVRQATTLGEDDARLTVPGRVWFVKPRRLKNGATLSRVMQGNLKEDMLWQLHDIMLTKSMLSHHRLDKYIKILDRV